MKRFKIALAALILTGGIVAAFAFTSKSSHKQFTSTTYYYKTGTCYQLIAPGVTDENDCKKSSLDATTFKATGNWTTTSNASFADGAYIAAITFNEGTGTGQITLQTALNGVWDSYVAQNPDALPSDGGTITVSGVSVTVNRKTAVN
jgi:Family of unknown function (DUF6520)